MQFMQMRSLIMQLMPSGSNWCT